MSVTLKSDAGIKYQSRLNENKQFETKAQISRRLKIKTYKTATRNYKRLMTITVQ